MKTTPSLAIIPIVVADQDEALCFYIEKLGLEKREDVTFGPNMRWLTVAAKGQKKPEIALTKPEASLLTTQLHSSYETVGYPGHGIRCIFDTDDCCKMHATLLARGIKFLSSPTKQVYGMEAVFEDPYGNAFSLLEPSAEAYALLKDASIITAA
jgi:predicted enzyme related to lactoylglutathione lyase